VHQLKIYTALPFDVRQKKPLLNQMELGAPPRHPVATAPSTDQPAPSLATSAAGTPSPEAVELTTEVNSLVSLLKNSLPFFIILLLRFLLSYAARISYIAFIALLHYRLSTELNYQISLKSSAQQRRNWALFGAALVLFLVVILVAPGIFQEQLWARYLLLPYQKPEMEFISVLWLAVLTDLSVKCALTTFKLGLNLFLTRYSSSTARNHPINSASRPASLSDYFQSGMFHVLFSFSLLCHSVAILLAQFSAPTNPHRPTNPSDIDLETGGRATEEPPIEGSELFSSFFLSPGITRRRSGSSPTPHAFNSPVHDSPDLASDDDSVDRLSHQAEVTSFLRAKRAFATVDLLCTVYRSVLPIPLWLAYFSNGPGSDVIPMAYLCVKVINLSSLIRAIVEVIRNSLAGRTV
jgi:hypothetical protein